MTKTSTKKKTEKVKKGVKAKKAVKGEKVKTLEKVEEVIKRTAQEMLEKMMVQAQVTVTGDTENGYQVNIKTEETGLLIGHHGETINSFQLLLGVILYRKMGVWLRVIVDVGDYRKAREENIKAMVDRIVEEVKTTGQEIALPPMTPLERRIVHTMLTDHPAVSSQSFGEGRDRRVTIKPR